MKTDKDIENAKKRADNSPVSQRKYTIDGKRFNVTRHFDGARRLNSIVTEVAVHRANNEMGLY